MSYIIYNFDDLWNSAYIKNKKKRKNVVKISASKKVTENIPEATSQHLIIDNNN